MNPRIKAAVDGIVRDLSDRSGLDGAWDGCDSDIQQEIKDTWAEIIEEALKEGE